MPKKCIICGKEASFGIKDTNDYYCPECAEENFSDIGALINIAETNAAQMDSMLPEDSEPNDL